MVSPGRAQADSRPSTKDVSPVWPSSDSSLAGTCGLLLQNFVLPKPHLPVSRRDSIGSRPSNTTSSRKSVSFRLRLRGPGPAYNSPSPQQPKEQPKEQCDTPQATGSAARGAVVRRLFRAVQGLPDSDAGQGSPEPQPKSYPGWRPQPQPAQPAQGSKPVTDCFKPFQPAAPPANASIGVPLQASDASDHGGSGTAVSVTIQGAQALGGVPQANPHEAGGTQVLNQPALAGCCSASHVSVWPSSTPAQTGPIPRQQFAVQHVQSSGLWPPQQQQQHQQVPSLQLQYQALQTQHPGLQLQGDITAQPAAAAGSSAAWDAAAPDLYPPPGPYATCTHPIQGMPGPSAGPPRYHGVIPSHVAQVWQQQPGCQAPTWSAVARHVPQPGPAAGAPVLGGPALAAASQAAAASGEAAPRSISAAASPQHGATFARVHLLLESLNLRNMLCSEQDTAACADTPASQMNQPGAACHAGGYQLSGLTGGVTSQAATSSCLTADATGNVPSSVVWQQSPAANETPARLRPRRTEGDGTGSKPDALRWSFDRAIASLCEPVPSADPHDAAEDANDTAGWFSTALQSASAAWLQSVGKAAAQQRQQVQRGGGVEELLQQVREARLERRLAEAYLLGCKLCVPRSRLERLRLLVEASGAPPAVTAALLVQLEDRLRLKAALRVLQLHAATAAVLQRLLRLREGQSGPLAAAAWRCWQRAAQERVALRVRMSAVTAARQQRLLSQLLSAWQAVLRRAADLRQREASLCAALSRRRRSACLLAWRSVQQQRAALRGIEAECRVARSRRLVRSWLEAARRVAHGKQQARRADAHHRSHLLLASLAHWRYLRVSRTLTSVWEEALGKR
ncbi:hypothetical protein Agub_g540, partial [Astrephomene gubernaculifera]